MTERIAFASLSAPDQDLALRAYAEGLEDGTRASRTASFSGGFLLGSVLTAATLLLSACTPDPRTVLAPPRPYAIFRGSTLLACVQGHKASVYRRAFDPSPCAEVSRFDDTTALWITVAEFCGPDIGIIQVECNDPLLKDTP